MRPSDGIVLDDELTPAAAGLVDRDVVELVHTAGSV
jgi:hypothetical protein